MKIQIPIFSFVNDSKLHHWMLNQAQILFVQVQFSPQKREAAMLTMCCWGPFIFRAPDMTIKGETYESGFWGSVEEFRRHLGPRLSLWNLDEEETGCE